MFDEIADNNEDNTGDKTWSFASKFLCFSNPEVYPIMDRINKRALEKLSSLDYCYTLRDIDKFLWQYGKEKYSE